MGTGILIARIVGGVLCVLSLFMFVVTVGVIIMGGATLAGIWLMGGIAILLGVAGIGLLCAPSQSPPD